MDEEEKVNKRDEYQNHLNEKQLSREEKMKDKENKNAVVAVYDLQAVMQLPNGNVSAFYYKSKLNVFKNEQVSMLCLGRIHTQKTELLLVCYIL